MLLNQVAIYSKLERFIATSDHSPGAIYCLWAVRSYANQNRFIFDVCLDMIPGQVD